MEVGIGDCHQYDRQPDLSDHVDQLPPAARARCRRCKVAVRRRGEQQRELGVHAVGEDSLDPCLEAVPKKAEMLVQLVVIESVLGDETKEGIHIQNYWRRSKVQ